MPSFNPLRGAYSAASYSVSSSDVVHSGNIQRQYKAVTQPKTLRPRTIPRHSFLIRVVIFVLMESGFTALVFTALHKPIFLHLSFTIPEVKSAVTAIAVIWHAAAVYAVKDVLLNIFSAEWVEQSNGTWHNLTLQELDIVSRLTTGFIDQLKHCISRRATHAFFLGFLSSFLLILLNGLGPSVISVDHVVYSYPHTIQVANLTIGAPGAPDDHELFLYPMSPRISALIQLEVIENATSLGYTSRQPNVLIPWPSSDSLSANMTVRYQSDVIRYNFSCSWKIPSFRDSSWTALMVANSKWDVPYTEGNLYPSIFPLAISSDGRLNKTNPYIAFLIVGMNVSTVVSLEDTPNLFVPCNTTQNPSFSHGHDHADGCQPMQVSVLMCNPQLEVLPATVTAVGSSLDAIILPGAPTVKNIPIEAANVLFSTSVRLPLTPQSIISPHISGRLFLSNSGYEINEETAIKPLSLPEINQNMTHILSSAAKAYLSGYKPTDDILSSSFATINTSGVIEVQKLALVGSKPFFVVLVATVGLLYLLLSALLVITRPDQLESFDLENIVERLQLSFFSDSTGQFVDGMRGRRSM